MAQCVWIDHAVRIKEETTCCDLPLSRRGLNEEAQGAFPPHGQAKVGARFEKLSNGEHVRAHTVMSYDTYFFQEQIAAQTLKKVRPAISTRRNI